MAEEEKELIDIEDAQRASERFILGRHSDAKVTFDKATLTFGTEPVYEVEGEFTSQVEGFSLFKIQVHAYSTKIVGYEM